MAQGQSEVVVWLWGIVLAMSGLAIVVIMISRLAVKRILHHRKQLREQELNHQHSLLVNSISAQERERKRIAGELHDELASRLNVIRLSLYQLKKHTPPELMIQTTELLDETIEITRHISHDLYPPVLSDFGLAQAIAEFLTPLEESLTINYQVRGNEHSQCLPLEKELQVLRIVQELVANSLKHAETKQINLLLRFSIKGVALAFSDKGKGFDFKQIKEGLGLRNIESRVQVLQGKFKIHSQLGHGTSAILVIPNYEKDHLRINRR